MSRPLASGIQRDWKVMSQSKTAAEERRDDGRGKPMTMTAPCPTTARDPLWWKSDTHAYAAIKVLTINRIPQATSQREPWQLPHSRETRSSHQTLSAKTRPRVRAILSGLASRVETQRSRAPGLVNPRLLQIREYAPAVRVQHGIASEKDTPIGIAGNPVVVAARGSQCGQAEDWPASGDDVR